MKILQVNFIDTTGGAAIAANRLNKDLLKNGIDSKMLVINKNSDDSTIIGPVSKVSKYLPKLRLHFSQRILKLQKTSNLIFHSLNIFPTGLHRIINSMDVDIVHLHWINAEMISIGEISKINKPIVWTLHDSWAFCGAEHHPAMENDYRYIDGYKRSNRNVGDSGIDLNRWVWKRKKKAWDNIKNLTLIAPSNWMANRARQSILFKDRKIEMIHVGMDYNLFRPRDKRTVREILEISVDKKIVLFGAMNATSDPLKGYDLLIQALRKLDNIKDVELLIFGTSNIDKLYINNIKIHFLGHISDNFLLNLFFNAADIFILPSMRENLPYVIMESLSCGTPVIAFDIGGISDMIDHKVNGYLAKPFGIDDLAKGIKWVLNLSSYDKLSKNTREKVIKEFDNRKIAEKHTELYNNAINNI